MKAAKYLMSVPPEVLDKSINLETYLENYLGTENKINLSVLHKPFIENNTLLGIIRFVENDKLAVYFILLDDDNAQNFVTHVNTSRTLLLDITSECTLLDITEEEVINIFTDENVYSKNILF